MFQNNCWTEVTIWQLPHEAGVQWCTSTSVLQLHAAVAQPWHDRSDEWEHAAVLNAGGASCIRRYWCSTKHRHDRGCAWWAFGNADRRMLRRFEIICFTNNSNPHAFLFLSDQLGHILEKEEEFSWGRQKCSVWWHDTSYGFTYAPRKCHILKFSFVRTHHARKNTAHCIFYWPEFKSPYRYWICFIHQTQAVS